jgi:hypothetical protein
MKTGKRQYKTLFSKVFEQNTELFDDYNYVYTGSLVLFRTVPHWKKIPEDLDVALDRNNKGTKELLEFYHRLKDNKKVDNLAVKTVFKRNYTIGEQDFEFKKYEQIDPDTIDQKVLETLLENGNIRIKYNIHGVFTELFPEKNGNGLTNLGVMEKDIIHINIKTATGNIKVPLLDYKAIAQGYVMNFLKEIIRNNIYRFTDLHSQPKDGMRLFSIISLLERQGEDASPEGVLKFIKETIKLYEKIPQQHRSKYINSAIQEFPWIEKMLKEIIKQYKVLIKRKDSKKYRFVSFYKKLWTYKKELNAYVNYLENDMLAMLKKDVLGEKYTITDAIKSFSQKWKQYNTEDMKKISQNLKKITQSIDLIWIKNKNESFAYFYEMYMLKNLFIKPIKRIL